MHSPTFPHTEMEPLARRCEIVEEIKSVNSSHDLLLGKTCARWNGAIVKLALEVALIWGEKGVNINTVSEVGQDFSTFLLTFKYFLPPRDEIVNVAGAETNRVSKPEVSNRSFNCTF